MAPERRAHVRAKFEAAKALEAGIVARRLPCEALIDGMGVRVDELTVFIPDVIVRCGATPPADATEVSDPMILVEVVSPSSHPIDSGVKLVGYFKLPSLRHYLVIDTAARAVTHHGRDAAGAISTRIVRDGMLALDPPGLEIEVTSVFATI